MFRRKKGFSHEVELQVLSVSSFAAYNDKMVLVEWKRGGKLHGLTREKRVVNGAVTFNEKFTFRCTLFRGKKSTGKFDKKPLKINVLLGGDVRKRTKICAHILNLGDIAPPSLHCGPEGIQVTVPATFKVGKSTHTAHIAVRLTPVYLGEGDGSDAVTATSIADVSSAAVGALGGNADDTDSEEDLEEETMPPASKEEKNQPAPSSVAAGFRRVVPPSSSSTSTTSASASTAPSSQATTKAEGSGVAASTTPAPTSRMAQLAQDRERRRQEAGNSVPPPPTTNASQVPSSSTNDVSELKQQLTDLRMDLQLAQSDVEELNMQREELEEQIASLTEQLDDGEERLQAAEKELEELQRQCDALKVEIQKKDTEIQRLKLAASTSTKSGADVSAEVASYREEVQELEKEVDRLSQQLEDADQKNAGLEEEVETLREELRAAEASKNTPQESAPAEAEERAPADAFSFVEENVFLARPQLMEDDDEPASVAVILAEVERLCGSGQRTEVTLHSMDKILKAIAVLVQRYEIFDQVKCYWLSTVSRLMSRMAKSTPGAFEGFSENLYHINSDPQRGLYLEGPQVKSLKFTASIQFRDLKASRPDQSDRQLLWLAFGRALQYLYTWSFSSVLIRMFSQVDSIVVEEAFDFSSFSSSLRKTSGRDCMDGMVLELDGTVSTLRDVSAPAKLVELLVKSTLKFLASRVVNSVLQGQGLVNTQTAFKLKMGLSKLHEWLSLPHVALLVQGSTSLRSIESVADVLLIKKSALEDRETREEVCNHGITDAQLVHLLMHFEPDPQDEKVKEVKDVAKNLFEELHDESDPVWDWLEDQRGAPPSRFFLEVSEVSNPPVQLDLEH